LPNGNIIYHDFGNACLKFETLSFIDYGLKWVHHRDARGVGVKSDKIFKKYDIITEYFGNFVTKKDIEMLESKNLNTYLLKFSTCNGGLDFGPFRDKLYEVSSKCYGVAAMINHSGGLSKRKANVMFCEVEGDIGIQNKGAVCERRVFAVATRDIKKGEELLADYNND
jgi:SET domain-containing protein